MFTSIDYMSVVCAAIQGLCSSPETSQRTPQSLAKKALQIADEVKKAYDSVEK